MKSSQLIVRILLCFVSLGLWAGAQATGQNSPAGAGGPGNGQGPIIIPRKTPPPPHAGLAASGSSAMAMPDADKQTLESTYIASLAASVRNSLSTMTASTGR